MLSQSLENLVQESALLMSASDLKTLLVRHGRWADAKVIAGWWVIEAIGRFSH